MPFIKINMLEGRADGEQKSALVELITKSVCDIVKCSREVVTVIFDEIRSNDWGSAGKTTDKPLFHPVVTIDMLDGKTKEQKRELIDAITGNITETTDSAREGVVIIFHDISRDDWGSGGLPKSATTK
jgi:4-oxalocrotonate tautomerase